MKPDLIEDFRYTINKHVAITAGAGTGKTYTLSRRYVNALLGFDCFTYVKRTDFNDIKISIAETKSALPIQIVTTTFTEAGAMEMRDRIERLISLMIRILEDENISLQEGEENEIKALLLLLDKDTKKYVYEKLSIASTTVYLSVISTIHKFAISIINKNSEIVPMDTTIDVIDDTIKNDIFDKLWFEVSNENQDIYLDIDNTFSLYTAKDFAKKYIFNKKVRDGLDSFINTKDENILKDILLKDFFTQNIDKIQDMLEESDGNFIAHKDEIESKEEYIANNHFAEFFEHGKLPTLKYGRSGLYTEINKFFTKKLYFLNEEKFKEIIEKLYILLKSLRDKYTARLTKDAKLDFDRILEVANDLLNNEKASINHYKYFFVDEFQDTNYFQWNMVKKAARFDTQDCANIFLVGDEKQSIFEFQGAEVSTFELAIKEIVDAKGIESIVQPTMSLNYRSDKDIISFVNKSFEKVMCLDDRISKKKEFQNQAINSFISTIFQRYINKEDVINNNCEVKYNELQANSKEKGSVKVLLKTLVPSTPEEKIEGYDAGCKSIHESYMIADFIEKIKKGEKEEYLDITQKLKDNQKAIAILCDAKANMLTIKDALKRVGLDCKVSASDDFFKAKEIVELYHILAMVEKLKADKDLWITANPDNDRDIAVKNNQNKQRRFYLAGGLRSKAFRYSDEDIFEYINMNKIPEDVKKVINLHDVLNLGELVDFIINHYEVQRVYSHLEDYPQVKANLKKFTRLAYEFVPLYDTPLSEFVQMLEAACLKDESSKEDQAFYESEQTNSIEIRTMHSSKGLAWPMVIVPELGRSLQGKNDSVKYATYKTNHDDISIVGFTINKNKTVSSSLAGSITEKKKYAEKKRLLYVAMTRPEKHLVLSVTTDNMGGFFPNSYWKRWLDFDTVNTKDISTTKIENNDFVDTISRYRNEDKLEIEKYSKLLESDEVLPVCEQEKIHMNEHILSIGDDNLETLWEVHENLKINDPFKYREAARFGTAAHLLLELGFKERVFNTPNEVDYIEKFIKKEDVTDSARLFKVVENFKDSQVYDDLQNSSLVLFEEEFNFFDKLTNSTQKRFIDLLYYKDEKWNIIDFKSNVLDKNRSKNDIIKEHEYDEQLKGYFDYIVSRYGSENINLCSILWLDDGTLSDLKPNSQGEV